MAKFDDKSNNELRGLIALDFGSSDSANVGTVSRDMQDKPLVTFSFTYDIRSTHATNTLTVNNIIVNESDDSGFATSNVVPAKNIIGDLTDVAFDTGAQNNAITTIKSFVIFNTKRYVNVQFFYDYVENVATGGARIFLNEEFTPTVTPEE